MRNDNMNSGATPPTTSGCARRFVERLEGVVRGVREGSYISGIPNSAP